MANAILGKNCAVYLYDGTSEWKKIPGLFTAKVTGSRAAVEETVFEDTAVKRESDIEDLSGWSVEGYARNVEADSADSKLYDWYKAGESRNLYVYPDVVNLAVYFYHFDALLGTFDVSIDRGAKVRISASGAGTGELTREKIA